ncbi:MAG: hypothetical protein U1F45_18680 [Burkholderiales bacterium]
MKRLTLLAGVVLAALPAVASAQDTARLVGTWECRVPGAEPTRTPPIVWFGGAYSEGKIVPSAIDLDGFARAVSGLSNVAAAADGWIQIQPQQGEPFTVKPLGHAGDRVPAMTLRRGNASYHCLRLPLAV